MIGKQYECIAQPEWGVWRVIKDLDRGGTWYGIEGNTGRMILPKADIASKWGIKK